MNKNVEINVISSTEIKINIIYIRINSNFFYLI